MDNITFTNSDDVMIIETLMEAKEKIESLLTAPIATELRLGLVAELYLKNATKSFSIKATRGFIPDFYGLKVIVRADMNPRGWEVIDKHGEVLKSGEI